MLSDLPPWLEEVKVTSAKEAGILLSCDTRDYGRKPIRAIHFLVTRGQGSPLTRK